MVNHVITEIQNKKKPPKTVPIHPVLLYLRIANKKISFDHKPTFKVSKQVQLVNHFLFVIVKHSNSLELQLEQNKYSKAAVETR